MNKKALITFAMCMAGLACGATVSLDSDGTAVVDGVRTFVYGAFRNPGSSREDFTSLKAAQFNLVHDDYFAHAIGSGYTGTDINQWLTEAENYLDAAAANGLGVAMSLPREVVLSQDTGNIGLIVNTLEFKPALWFWILMEEPTEIGSIASTIQQANTMVKTNDTMHPTVIIDSDAGLNGQGTVGTHCDAIWAKNHRIPFSQTAIAREISAIKSAYGSKPVWAFCQAGDAITNFTRTGLYASKITVSDKTCAVTSNSLRGQAHAAISAGAMGLIYDIPDKTKHDIKVDTPALWQGVVNLGAEIDELSPALLSTDAVPAYALTDTEWGKWGMPNRMRHLYGAEGEALADPPIGLPTIDHVLHWTRSYQGRFYIGFAADYMCLNRMEVLLSFQIDKVFQHPGNTVVITINPGTNPTINYAAIPAAIWDVQNSSIMFVLNETDSLVWSMSQ